MKKLMFFAIAAAGLLTSCTSEDNFDAGAVSQDFTADGRMPIEISMGKVATVNTRGTGTVGDTTGTATNVWRNQRVNILMFKKGTLDLALIDSLENPYPIYDRTEFRTQSIDGSFRNRALDMTDSIKYYPTRGMFDFWGYRLDGADAGFTAPVTTSNITADVKRVYYPGDTLKLDFKIDGTQDVMAAKAEPSAVDLASRADAAARAFSAFSARNGVQPELIFKHLLTRLNFVIIAGDSSATGVRGIYVDTISVKSKTTGKLIAAYAGSTRVADENLIQWEDAKEDLFLMRRPTPADPSWDATEPAENQNLVELDPVAPTGTGGPFTNDFVADSVKIGEALLVAPDSEYIIDVKMHQTVIIKDDGVNPAETVVKTFSTSDKLKPAGGDPFQMGHTYKVAIKLYGLSDIRITTTLTGWQEGEIIPITPEDNY
ncbi:MAG: fimbrillin family protein [Prevotella sp.]|nr:fimbrillin family protein [Prevotella sp.]